MFRNYLKTSIRNFYRNKFSSFINVAGLAIGMTVAILIGLWIYDEISFNRSFSNYTRIASVMQNLNNNGEVQTWAELPYPLADELRNNYGSDFKQVVMTTNFTNRVLSYGEKKLKKQGIFAEPAMLEMFSVKMLEGNWMSLSNPTSIIISSTAAKAYFGNQDPLNKVLKFENDKELKVTGVFEDFPRNSIYNQMDFVIPWEFFAEFPDGIKTYENPWGPSGFLIYAQLNENANITKASFRIRDAKLKKMSPESAASRKPELFLFPMSKWHLYSEFRNGKNIGGSIQYVWMFGIIGAFVLLLACINFMNLSTARSEKRAREVGIRKTIGSLRAQLIFQFFAESLLTTIFAFALSILLVQLILPYFNEVADKKMSILWDKPFFWLLCLVFIFLTGLIAGSYPALYLSSFRPVKVMKGTFKAGRLAAIPRKALVVLQFTVSVSLIIATVIVYRQIQFAKNRPVGYDRANLISVPTPDTVIHQHFNAIKDELMKSGAIAAMTESGRPTTSIWGSTGGLSWKGKDPNLSDDFSVVDITYDYGKTVGWEIKEGRDYSTKFGGDATGLILNESAIRFMGLEHPIGETVIWEDKKYTIIGVVRNLVMTSPYDEPRPTIFCIRNRSGNVAIIKLNPSTGIKDAISKIETTFKKFDPEQIFEYQFTDLEYARKFGDEERVGKLAGFFAILAIAISCMGLFGLASFVAEQRTREIGVRKVLGASVFNVWNLMSKEFTILVFISFLLSIPLSYYFMHSWLQNYHYRTEISWWVFLVSGLGAILITLLTVSYQSIKAALMNPVGALRNE